MAKKIIKTTKPDIVEEEETQSKSSLFDYLRFGESYTSLILGIIVVIISTVLLLSFVHNKNTANDTPQLLSQKDIALPSTPLTTETPAAQDVKATYTPTPVVSKAPAISKAPVVTQKPTVPTVVPTKKVEPAKVAQGGVNPAKGEYAVAAGDNLWIIAEKQYKSGYNWVDIARANNLSNPGMISAGQKLKLPQVEQKIATIGARVEAKSIVTQPNTSKITGDSYQTIKGDSLWNIAVRAYGDGYQWSKIARANNLSNPSLIHSGNALKIPR